MATKSVSSLGNLRPALTTALFVQILLANNKLFGNRSTHWMPGEEISMNRSIQILAAGLMCLVLGCGFAWAQGGTAQISGTVKDQTAAVLPGVEVTATQTDTGLARTAISNETGFYAFPN